MAESIEFKVRTEYIELQQLLKATDIIGSGGDARAFLSEYEVRINGEPDNRRGRKLRPGDNVEIEGVVSIRVI